MTASDTSRSQDGFTLVELLVATAMSLIVFAAALSTLIVFNNASQTLTHRNDSQNQARLGMDQIVSQLRNVASTTTPPAFVERATPDDLVFQTISNAAGVNAVERVRYCVPTSAGPATEPLIVQIQTTPTAAIPWSANACPDTSGGSTAATLLTNVTNVQHATAVFTYSSGSGSLGATPSDLTAITSVAINLFVNPEPTDAGNEYELQSSALLRNAQAAPTAAFTWSQGASGTANLDAGASYSPAGSTLTYAWSYSAGGAQTTIASTAGTFQWSPGPGTYTVTLAATDQAGYTTTVAHQVTIS